MLIRNTTALAATAVAILLFATGCGDGGNDAPDVQSPTPSDGDSSLTGRIAFHSDPVKVGDEIFEGGIWVVPADGGERTLLVVDASEPAASPDGTRLAFASDGDGDFLTFDTTQIYIIDLESGFQTRLTSEGANASPDWLQDGSQIAFISDRDGNSRLYVMNADGSDQMPLTSNSLAGGQGVWSPDGTRIAYVSEASGVPDIWVVDADGTDPTNLTNDAAKDFSPDWSPDGTQIAFGSDRVDPNPGQTLCSVGSCQSDIFVMNADGTGIVNLTNHPGIDTGPSWSPDGEMIAFSTDRGQTQSINQGIYVMNADGTDQKQLTDGTTNDASPTWIPTP